MLDFMYQMEYQRLKGGQGMSETLYDLQASYMQVLAMLDEGEDVQDTLDAISDAMGVKFDNIGKIIQMYNARQESIKLEEKRLKARRDACNNQVDRLKQYVSKTMQSTNKRKVEGDLFTFSIRKNPAKLVIVSEDEIPLEYYVPVAPKLDAALVKDSLKNGLEVPGVALEQGESLQIK